MTDAAAPPSRSSDRPVALVTGPTSGLGASFARLLAQQGYDLVLVARDEERLRNLAIELEAAHGTSSESISADLATEKGRAAVASRLAKGVDVLINNAGFATRGEFWDTDLELLQAQLAVTVTAVMELTHAALPAMRAAGRGTIINVASVSGLLTGPESAYGADKAWVVKFSEGLAHQLAGSGVRVQALCPGYMKTEFHARAGQDASGVPSAWWSDPDDVARTGLADAAKGWAVSIPGWRYKLYALVDRLKPRRLVWRS
ncbi:SDR family NAD(P)-dependent oxidoreductase [Rhodococcus ruber]|uniref:SDR family NAD(P)-dependent oxidoreductase n=1 Tax=Rhodococcus ruber TaxID=1830 RepID=UPI00265E95E9|nr:SDR family oxidoreductase [Rhodococcus ruber]MDO1481310.1 SDR family oxidoreductase [Rhodococcus ruber]